MKYVLVFLMLILLTSFTKDSSPLLSEYIIDDIYEKIELKPGTLDEDGNDIGFVFTKSQIKQGQYEVSISDGPGDLYEINGTDYFIEFMGYFGYAGYGKKGVLIINSYGTGKFIKYDD